MAYLYITEPGAVLKRTGERLVVAKEDARLLDIPAAKVEGVLIFGNVQFTTQALQLLLHQGIELALFSSHGRLLGQLTSPFTKNIVLRQAQYARHGDPAFALAFARAIVKAKMSNGLELLREFAHNHPDTDLGEEASRLAGFCAEVDAQADLATLLGVEGIGARTYFQGLARMLRHSFRFSGRQRHPAPDPVNALLSLGYTLVYNEISSLLDGLGFDPYLGFFHQPSYGHATLASDLLEQFRAPLTDRLTLSLINNRVLKEEDFYLHTASGSVYLTDEARKRYFQEYEHFVTRPAGADQEGTPLSFRQLFRRQAERLKETITTEAPYRPYSFSW